MTASKSSEGWNDVLETRRPPQRGETEIGRNNPKMRIGLSRNFTGREMEDPAEPNRTCHVPAANGSFCLVIPREKTWKSKTDGRI